MKLQFVRNGAVPPQIVQMRLLHVEAQRLLLRIVRCELDNRSVGDNFLDDEFGVLCVKSYFAAKRRNVDMPAIGPDAWHVPRENSQVASFNLQFLDGD